MCITVPSTPILNFQHKSVNCEINKPEKIIEKLQRKNPRWRRGCGLDNTPGYKGNTSYSDESIPSENERLEDDKNIENTDASCSTVLDKVKRRRRRRRRGKREKNEHVDSVDESSSGNSSASDCGSITPLHQSSEINTPTKKNITKIRKRSGKKKKIEGVLVPVDSTSESEKARYLAIDCEMVGIGENGLNSALARVSIVDWSGDLIYNNFVRVLENVTDYRTFVSGITHQNVESDEAVCFGECRKTVLEIIKGRVVVGHGLKNDFRVLKIDHPWHDIRDSARYEPLMKSDPCNPGVLLPRKLKDLASVYAQATIQRAGEHHCPIEDATAAMMVFRAKKVKWERAIKWKLEKTNSMNGHRSFVSSV